MRLEAYYVPPLSSSVEHAAAADGRTAAAAPRSPRENGCIIGTAHRAGARPLNGGGGGGNDSADCRRVDDRCRRHFRLRHSRRRRRPLLLRRGAREGRRRPPSPGGGSGVEFRSVPGPSRTRAAPLLPAARPGPGPGAGGPWNKNALLDFVRLPSGIVVSTANKDGIDGKDATANDADALLTKAAGRKRGRRRSARVRLFVWRILRERQR